MDDDIEYWRRRLTAMPTGEAYATQTSGLDGSPQPIASRDVRARDLRGIKTPYGHNRKARRAYAAELRKSTP